jgi:hypothetical protein
VAAGAGCNQQQVAAGAWLEGTVTPQLQAELTRVQQLLRALRALSARCDEERADVVATAGGLRAGLAAAAASPAAAAAAAAAAAVAGAAGAGVAGAGAASVSEERQQQQQPLQQPPAQQHQQSPLRRQQQPIGVGQATPAHRYVPPLARYLEGKKEA